MVWQASNCVGNVSLLFPLKLNKLEFFFLSFPTNTNLKGWSQYIFWLYLEILVFLDMYFCEMLPSGTLEVCPSILDNPVIFLFWLQGRYFVQNILSIIVQQDATIYSLLYFCKLLYMFRVVTPPIIRSTYNCNYCVPTSAL
jgi:hypothetical protein